MNLNDPVILGMLIKGLTAFGLIVVGLALIVSGHFVRKDRTKIPTMAKAVTKWGSVHIQSSSVGVIIICFGAFTALGGGWAGISKIEISQSDSGTSTKISEIPNSEQTQNVNDPQAAKRKVAKATAAVLTSAPKEKKPGEWITTVTIVEDEGKEITSYEFPLKDKEDNGPVAMAVGEIVTSEPEASPIKAYGASSSLIFSRVGMRPEASYVVEPNTAEAVKAQLGSKYGAKPVLLKEDYKYKNALQELNESYFCKKAYE